MTTDNDLYSEIASEYEEGGFSGDLNYAKPRTEFTRAARYKVNNPNPQNPAAFNEATDVGLVLKTFKGKEIEKTEVAKRVRAVILFTSYQRQVARGSGKAFQIVCQSHDAIHPSVRIDAPLCRKATAQDVAQIFSQWKGYDTAKVDAKVKEVTEDTGKLQVCGLKASNGFITLCPFAKKDPVTGVKAACQQRMFLHGYDIDNKREFQMELTGRSIDSGKFIAPIHQFYQFLQSQGVKDESGKTKGLPSYAFVVELSALKNGSFYILDVQNWKPIAQVENRNEMKTRAYSAKERYEKSAARLSKEAYEKQKAASQPAPATQAPAAPVAATTVKLVKVDAPPPSFNDDDDINF